MRIANTLVRRATPIATAIALGATAPRLEAQVQWTDWQSFGANVATGTLTVGSGTSTVTYNGPYAFVQTGCGTNYWSPTSSYGGSLAPPPCDMVALNTGGAKTITFSTPVVNPYLAFLSWNGQTPITLTGLNGATVVTPSITVVGTGPSAFGSGTTTASGAVVTFNGENGGLLQLQGTYTQIGFTDLTENWHGFTVGAAGLAGATTVPEPATVVLLGAGLLGVGLTARRRRRAR